MNPMDAAARLDRLKDQWLHDYGETLLLHRAALAKGHGLIAEDYVSPMPGTVDSSTTNNYFGVPMADNTPAAAAPTSGQAPAAQPIQQAAAAAPSLFTRILPWALTAGMGFGGLGAAAGYFLHGQPLAAVPPAAVATPGPPAATVPAPAPTVAQPAPVELEVQWKLGPNGKWQVVTKPVPPGS